MADARLASLAEIVDQDDDEGGWASECSPKAAALTRPPDAAEKFLFFNIMREVFLLFHNFFFGASVHDFRSKQLNLFWLYNVHVTIHILGIWKDCDRDLHSEVEKYFRTILEYLGYFLRTT